MSFLTPAILGLGVGKFGLGSSTPAQNGSDAAGSSRSPAPAPTSASPSGSGASTPSAQSKSWYSRGLGAVAVGAAAMGGAYYSREHFINGWKYGYDHMTFVGNLWDADALEKRLQGIEELRVKHGVAFAK